MQKRLQMNTEYSMSDAIEHWIRMFTRWVHTKIMKFLAVLQVLFVLGQKFKPLDIMKKKKRKKEKKMEWKYYDFRSNWSNVYKILHTIKVQDILYNDMQIWYDHFNEPCVNAWFYGEPLWTCYPSIFYSDASYMADKYINENYVYENYDKALKRIGLKSLAKDKDGNYIHNKLIQEEIKELFLPKPGSIESMVLRNSANFLYRTYEAVAKQLFPDDFIYISEQSDQELYSYYVTIPEKKLIFDIGRNCMYGDRDGADDDPSNPKIVGEIVMRQLVG
jgi:hypothetical protein